MKKIILGVLLLGFCVGTSVYLSSCAKIADPLGPTGQVTGGASGNNQTGPYPVSFTMPSFVSGTANVIFSTPIDSSTLNTNTVRLFTQDDAGTSETPYTAFTISYIGAAKMMVLTPSNGAWANDKRYHGVLTTGIRSTNGRSLDGNANNISESAEFDNSHGYDSLGIPMAPGYVSTDNNGLRSVQVAALSWASNSLAGGLSFGGFTGNVGEAYSYVTVTVQFGIGGGNPVDFAMDPSTFFTGATSLHPNIVFTDINGTAVTPVNVTVTSTDNPNAHDTLSIAFAPAPSTKYVFQVRGGLTGVRSSSAGTILLNRGFYFDGNMTGFGAEATDDTRQATFMTRDAAGSLLPQVMVSSVNFIPLTRQILITFAVPGPTSGQLDPASVNLANFKLVDNATGIGISPAGGPVLDNTLTYNPTVAMYVPLHFSESGLNTSRLVRVIVSKDVRSSDGIYMDQNGDGITGTPSDNSLSTISAQNF